MSGRARTENGTKPSDSSENTESADETPTSEPARPAPKGKETYEIKGAVRRVMRMTRAYARIDLMPKPDKPAPLAKPNSRVEAKPKKRVQPKKKYRDLSSFP